MILAFEANNASIHTSLKCKYFYLVLRSLCSSTLFVTLLESVDRMKSSENSSLLLSWCEFSFRLISRGYATYTLCCCCCFKVLKQEKSEIQGRRICLARRGGDKIVWKKGAKLNVPAPFSAEFPHLMSWNFKKIFDTHIFYVIALFFPFVEMQCGSRK